VLISAAQSGCRRGSRAAGSPAWASICWSRAVAPPLGRPSQADGSPHPIGATRLSLPGGRQGPGGWRAGHCLRGGHGGFRLNVDHRPSRCCNPGGSHTGHQRESEQSKRKVRVHVGPLLWRYSIANAWPPYEFRREDALEPQRVRTAERDAGSTVNRARNSPVAAVSFVSMG
jgi:hypothetical protein